MSDDTLPPMDFIVIGAIKAATTWLQAQLDQHPDISIPEIEPHYFTREHSRGAAWYRSLFPDTKAAGSLWGEKTADYLAKPEAAERIAKAYPDVKLIAQLRNPVDRAYADYKMLFRRGTVTGPPEQYLTWLDNEQPRFLNDGLYAAHLRRWMRLFPPENLLVITFDDVRDHPQRTLTSVLEHLGARPYDDPEAIARRYNDSSEKLLPMPVRKALAPLKPLARPYRDNALFRATRGLFAKPISYPPLSSDLREHLAEFYSQDVRELESMLGRDLSHWVPATSQTPPSALALQVDEHAQALSNCMHTGGNDEKIT
ncbi:MAG: sulfotransferase [Erythrobacter sp.]|uniref:sulfotransferase family protein n=1 Tax=Erythrobacter sp. TaxID=1042 RepID=UPI003C76EF0A